MMKHVLWLGVSVMVLGLMVAAPARADDWDKKSVLTFSQPFEIPGHVLPAGTYTFKLADTMSDRHIVQVFNADGTMLIATVMTIPDHRLKTTNETVIRFNEVPRGQPETIRAWFYPGNSVGQEFVYPKPRAAELARLLKVPVPAVEVVHLADVTMLKSAPIVAITPDEREVPVAAAIQVAAPAAVPATVTLEPVAQTASNPVPQQQASNRQSDAASNTLPQTATNLPLIALVGFVALCLGALLMMFRKRVPVGNR